MPSRPACPPSTARPRFLPEAGSSGSHLVDHASPRTVACVDGFNSTHRPCGQDRQVACASVKQKRAEPVIVLCFGRKGQVALNRRLRHSPILDAVESTMASTPKMDLECRPLTSARCLCAAFVGRGIRRLTRCTSCTTRFKSVSSQVVQRPTFERVLPLSAPEGADDESAETAASQALYIASSPPQDETPGAHCCRCNVSVQTLVLGAFAREQRLSEFRPPA